MHVAFKFIPETLLQTSYLETKGHLVELAWSKAASVFLYQGPIVSEINPNFH